MRLKCHDQTARRNRLGRGDDRGDFGWMVAVVFDDDNAVEPRRAAGSGARRREIHQGRWRCRSTRCRAPSTSPRRRGRSARCAVRVLASGSWPSSTARPPGLRARTVHTDPNPFNCTSSCRHVGRLVETVGDDVPFDRRCESPEVCASSRHRSRRRSPARCWRTGRTRPSGLRSRGTPRDARDRCS